MNVLKPTFDVASIEMPLGIGVPAYAVFPEIAHDWMDDVSMHAACTCEMPAHTFPVIDQVYSGAVPTFSIPEL